MEMKYCQSCGMPLESEEVLGTNRDGSKNEDYCVYCYEDGAFTSNCTMEEMIEFCLDSTAKSGLYTDRAQGKQMMLEWFPTLTRWRQALG